MVSLPILSRRPHYLLSRPHAVSTLISGPKQNSHVYASLPTGTYQLFAGDPLGSLQPGRPLVASYSTLFSRILESAPMTLRTIQPLPPTLFFFPSSNASSTLAYPPTAAPPLSPELYFLTPTLSLLTALSPSLSLTPPSQSRTTSHTPPIPLPPLSPFPPPFPFISPPTQPPNPLPSSPSILSPPPHPPTHHPPPYFSHHTFHNLLASSRPLHLPFLRSRHLTHPPPHLLHVPFPSAIHFGLSFSLHGAPYLSPPPPTLTLLTLLPLRLTLPPNPYLSSTPSSFLLIFPAPPMPTTKPNPPNPPTTTLLL